MLPSLGIGRQEPALFPLNPPSWSLFFELVVNVAYAALFPRLTIKMIAIVVALAGVGLVALAVSHGNLHAGSHWHNFAGGFARVVYSFGAGVLICRSKVKLLKTPPLLILTACAAMFAISPGRYTGAYELTCVLILLPGLVALGAANEPSEFLRPKMAYLGLISYGVYSLHFPLALAAKGMLTKLHGEDISSLTPWAGIIFLFGITIACGAVDKLYDTKVRAFLTSRFALAIARKQVVRVNTTKL
jgi:peptidoglycan/LPS O-acetylase OafA/YrhL